MLQNFADAVLTGAALIAPGEDGSKTLSLVNAAYLSAWQGRKVALPVDMDEYNMLLQEKISASRTGTSQAGLRRSPSPDA